jgi:hypothetical protein
MERWKLTSCVVFVVLALVAGPAAAEKKNGEPGSHERKNHCAREYINCMMQGQQECRSEYTSAEDINRCDQTRIRQCDDFWGPNSNCVTRASDGPATTAPSAPGGGVQSQPSRAPSRIPPRPQETESNAR